MGGSGGMKEARARGGKAQKGGYEAREDGVGGEERKVLRTPNAAAFRNDANNDDVHDGWGQRRIQTVR